MGLTGREVYCENLVFAFAAVGKVYWRLENCDYYYFHHHHRRRRHHHHHHHHQVENLYRSVYVRGLEL